MRRTVALTDMKSLLYIFLAMSVCAPAMPQDRLEGMARFDRYERLRRNLSKSVVRNDFPKPKWSDDGRSFSYVVDKKQFEYVVADGESKQVPLQKEPKPQPFRRSPARLT